MIGWIKEEWAGEDSRSDNSFQESCKSNREASLRTQLCASDYSNLLDVNAISFFKDDTVERQAQNMLQEEGHMCEEENEQKMLVARCYNLFHDSDLEDN